MKNKMINKLVVVLTLSLSSFAFAGPGTVGGGGGTTGGNRILQKVVYNSPAGDDFISHREYSAHLQSISTLNPVDFKKRFMSNDVLTGKLSNKADLLVHHFVDGSLSDSVLSNGQNENVDFELLKNIQSLSSVNSVNKALEALGTDVRASESNKVEDFIIINLKTGDSIRLIK